MFEELKEVLSHYKQISNTGDTFYQFKEDELKDFLDDVEGYVLGFLEIKDEKETLHK